MKKGIKIGALMLVAIVIAFALEIVQLCTQPELVLYEYEMPEDMTQIFLQENISYFHAVYENGIFTPTGADPQMSIDVRDAGTIRSVMISLADIAENSIQYQVFYDMDGSGYSEANSQWESVYKGRKTSVFYLPEGNYQSIRIDINDEMPLASIECTSQEVIRSVPVLIEDRPHPVRLIIVSLFVFVLELLWVGLRIRKRTMALAERFFGHIWTKRRKYTVEIIGAMIVAGLASIAMYHFLWYIGYSATIQLKAFCITATLLIATIFVLRETLKDRPEYAFALIALSAGVLLVFILPSNTYSTWDEEYHFETVLNTSYVDEVRYTKADEDVYFRRLVDVYDQDELEEQNEQRNQDWKNGVTIIEEKVIDYKAIWAVLGGFLMFLGRVVDAPYHMIILLGKLGNLLTYVIIGFFAIRRLKSGKMLWTVLLLGPTTLLMASSYSYDPFVISSVALAFGYYFREWQEPDKSIEWKNALIMIGALAIGCLPKAIYICMLPIFLFMPQKKFATDEDRKRYYAIILLATILVLMTFMLPFLINMDSRSDYRGGSNVDSGLQVKHILLHPLTYIKTLLTFLKDYFSVENMADGFTRLAYRGHTSNYWMYVFLLFAVAITDKSECDRLFAQQTGIRVFGHLVLFIQVALCATALYVSFTPVAYETILGCQKRYLLPVLYPSLFMLFSGKIQNNMNRTAYNSVVLAVAGYIALNAVLTNVIGLY